MGIVLVLSFAIMYWAIEGAVIGVATLVALCAALGLVTREFLNS